MTTIRLATDDDLRTINSQNVAGILQLPHLYVPTDEPDVMRSWGVARSDGGAPVSVYERLHPGSLVVSSFVGQYASRAELLYNGAEPASDFLASAP